MAENEEELKGLLMKVKEVPTGLLGTAAQT